MGGWLNAAIFIWSDHGPKLDGAMGAVSGAPLTAFRNTTSMQSIESIKSIEYVEYVEIIEDRAEQ